MVFHHTWKAYIGFVDDDHIYKSHNKTLLMYHLVFPLKYRKKVITEESGNTLVDICGEISERYEIEYIEIGHESNHVHFLVQSVPSMSVTEVVRTLKSITAREMFCLHSEIKSLLWGGNFWSSQVDFMPIRLACMQVKK